MRTSLTVVTVHPAGSQAQPPDLLRHDVLLELTAQHTVGQLEKALAELFPGASPGVWLDEDPLDPAATVEVAGIRAGVVLSLGAALPHRPAPAARAELRLVSGPDAGAIYLLPDGDSVVGSDAAVSVSGTGIAPHQLCLSSSPAGVVATDLDPQQPVLRAGLPLSGPTPVGASDLLAVGDHLLTVVPVVGAPPGTRPCLDEGSAVRPGPDLTLELIRPPRLRAPAEHRIVELPVLGPRPEPRRLAVMPLALPVLAGVVMAIISSPYFLLFAVLSPLMALATHWSEQRTAVRTWQRLLTAHDQAQAESTTEINRLAEAETLARRWASPDAAALLRTATGPDSRLWERRRTDDDCLVLRVGTSTASPTSWTVTVPAGAESVAQGVLHDVPVTVPLREVGVLGIAGPPKSVRALARWLVGQAVVLHSPRDLSVWLLADADHESSAVEAEWGWLRWLPHASCSHEGCSGEAGSGEECVVLLGTTPASVGARAAELCALVASRLAASRDVRAREAARPSDVLVVLDGARALRTVPGMADVLRDGPSVGVHLLCLDDQERLLPEECQAVLALDTARRLAVRRTGLKTLTGVRADLVGTVWAEQVARALAPLRDPMGAEGAGQLPTSVRLLDVLALDPPTSEAVGRRWGCTTEAVVGRDATGPFRLDLTRDGPHVLVAGTTGSGKSELLQTLVASLAVANRPDAMSFVLVDYKGGAAFQDCARLPHTVGVVTDLDGALVERALASLSAELKRRERLLGVAGQKDLEGYLAAGAPQGPLPRLVLIIDEFASLVEELPEFVRGLVAIAQRGRSLGVHLVLATQRPSGVVSPEIRANTGLRIGLRVTDSAESLDVLDSPVAASISRSTPGRAYARTGPGALSPFQSARVSGRAPVAGPPVPAPLQVRALPWSHLGAPLPPLLEQPWVEDVERASDLQALVEASRAAAAELGVASGTSPWLAPLPESVTLEALGRESHDLGKGLPPVPFALEDLPGEQAQRPACFDLDRGGHLLVAGGPRSGRSTLLRTLAASLAETVSPSDAHLYVLDCGSGALLPLAQLPHCGAVVQRSQVDRADRLLTRLAAEVSRRHQQLAERGFADLAEQRAGTADPLPYLVLLVDSWEGLTNAFGDVDGGRIPESLLELVREGAGAGLRLVITGDRGVLLGKLGSAVPDRLVLRLADRADYALAGLVPRNVPAEVLAGRAFRAETGRALQVALLVPDPSGAAQTSALDELAATLPPARGRKPFRVDVLPDLVTVPAANALGEAGVGAPFAVGGDELRFQTVNLAVSGPGFTIAGPARSGRTNALLVLGRALLSSGTNLCLVMPRPSALNDLAGLPGVSVAARAEQLETVVQRAPSVLAVLVDDAELVDESMAEVLGEVLRIARQRDLRMVLAGETDGLAAAYRGFAFEARRSRSGLLLCPDSHLHGELLGIRLPRSAAFRRPAGRGILVRSGQSLLVQVPLAEPETEPDALPEPSLSHPQDS